MHRTRRSSAGSPPGSRRARAAPSAASQPLPPRRRSRAARPRRTARTSGTFGSRGVAWRRVRRADWRSRPGCDVPGRRAMPTAPPRAPEWRRPASARNGSHHRGPWDPAWESRLDPIKTRRPIAAGSTTHGLDRGSSRGKRSPRPRQRPRAGREVLLHEGGGLVDRRGEARRRSPRRPSIAASRVSGS